MRIVILAHELYVSGGISVGKNIVATLPKIAPQHQYLITIPPGLAYERHDEKKNVSVIEIKPMNRLRKILHLLRILPKITERFNPDVIVGLANQGLFKPSCRQVILFHRAQLVYHLKNDMRNLYGYKARCKYLLLKTGLRKCLGHTQIVFCQTPVIKERFAKTFNFPSQQIKLMPNAVSKFVKEPRKHTTKPQIFENDKYFNLFFLTQYHPHKNLEILIDIFRTFRKDLDDVRCIITIGAEQHKQAPKLLKDIEKYGLQEHVINVGPLEQKELAAYFYHSGALFFPSLLESFSATYLEAMHFGLPILTSDLDFARYVCGDTAVYFDPWDTEDVVEKILLLKNTPPLQKELVQKGKIRVSTFYKNWGSILGDVTNELELLVNQQAE